MTSCFIRLGIAESIQHNLPWTGRVNFPEIHNLIELNRKRSFSARTVTNEKLLEALKDGKKKEQLQK